MTVSAELVLRWAGGSLDLMDWNESAYGDFELFTIGDGTSWGNPESVRRVLRNAMADGSRSVKDRDTNRTVTLKIRVSASDARALSGGEAALDLIDGRACELVWTPPNEYAAPAVFVVDFADLDHETNDFRENQLERFYTLSLDCLPHAYSDEWVEVEAIPQGVATPILVDDCASTTGWIGYGLTLTDGGDYIQIMPSGDGDATPGTARRLGVVDFTTDRYLAVEYGQRAPTRVQVSPVDSGSFVTVAQVGLEGSFALYDVGIAVDAIDFTYPSGGGVIGADGSTGRILTLNQQYSLRTSAGAGQVRSIVTPGTRRTPATLIVDSGEDPLGSVVIYSGPDYDPSLINRLAPGSPGHFVSNAQPETAYRFPVSQLPAGPSDYSVWAQTVFAITAYPATLEFKAELHSGAGVLRETVLDTVTITDGMDGILGADGDGMRPLFSATLPPWNLPDGSPHDFVFRVTMTDGEGTVLFPWMWLFNTSAGDLKVLECGAASKLWLEPPSMTRDHASIQVGATTQSEAIPLSLDSEILAGSGAQSIPPGLSTLYTWSSDGAVEAYARSRPAWHTHPPRLSALL